MKVSCYEDNFSAEIISIICCFIVFGIFLLSFYIPRDTAKNAYKTGYNTATEDFEQRAIDAGVGEYYINDEMEKDFRWLYVREEAGE